MATSIENNYTTNEDIKKLYSDYSSLLRIFQGKEIDFLKTGFRWHMNTGLRKHLKQLPYFLLFNYPKKLSLYKKLSEKNKLIENKEDKVKLNAFHSPSPMNELCHYISTWEKKNILWNNNVENLTNTKDFIINKNLDLSDRKIIRIARRYINEFSDEIRKHIKLHHDKPDNESQNFNMDQVADKLKIKLFDELNLDEEAIANYVIKASYNSFSISKSFAWTAYGDYIIKNLRNNSSTKRNISITEVPFKTNNSYEYLGKYYEFTEADEYRKLFI